MPHDGPTRRRLLALARSALHAQVKREPAPAVPADLIVNAFGVFVTIHHRGDLRGCLGSLDCHGRIVESIARLAGAVAYEDHRFAPLTEHELVATIIDLSLLTAPEQVTDHVSIEIGRHGLIVQHGRRKGLLLPQVAPEYGWDRITFLSHTCLKAGLPGNAWQNGATILRFEAEVFSEQTCEEAATPAADFTNGRGTMSRGRWKSWGSSSA
jgi:AmmeMemoRadiSam system protein A